MGEWGEVPFPHLGTAHNAVLLVNAAIRNTLPLKWENGTSPYSPPNAWDKIALRKALLLRCCKHFF